MGSRKGAFRMTRTVLPFTKPISTMRLRKPPCPLTLTMTPRSPVRSSESFNSADSPSVGISTISTSNPPSISCQPSTKVSIYHLFVSLIQTFSVSSSSFPQPTNNISAKAATPKKHALFIQILLPQTQNKLSLFRLYLSVHKYLQQKTKFHGLFSDKIITHPYYFVNKTTYYKDYNFLTSLVRQKYGCINTTKPAALTHRQNRRFFVFDIYFFSINRF